jgi:hypothetical protein
MDAVSPAQRARTHQEIMRNLDRMAQSDMFKAMMADAERFGVDAVLSAD